MPRSYLNGQQTYCLANTGGTLSFTLSSFSNLFKLLMETCFFKIIIYIFQFNFYILSYSGGIWTQTSLDNLWLNNIWYSSHYKYKCDDHQHTINYCCIKSLKKIYALCCVLDCWFTTCFTIFIKNALTTYNSWKFLILQILGLYFY